MATPLIGNASLLQVDTFGGGVTVSLAFQVDATITMSQDTLESTNKDSAQFKEYEGGNKGLSLSYSGKIDSQAGGDAAGMILVRDALIAGNKIDVEFMEAGTALTIAFTGIIQDCVTTYPQNDIQAFSGTIIADGAYSSS